MFFDSFYSLARIAVVAVLAYVALIVILRLAGKRALGKMHIFDFAVTIAVGSILGSVLLTKDATLADGIVAFATLAVLQWLVARLSLSSSLVESAVLSTPRLLLDNGRYCDEALADERVTRAEVEAAIRAAGIGKIESVGAVVLEANGELSVIPGDSKEMTALSSVRG